MTTSQKTGMLQKQTTVETEPFDEENESYCGIDIADRSERSSAIGTTAAGNANDAAPLDGNARKVAMNVLLFAVFTKAACARVLNPNYPLMALSGGHEDAFPSTGPFDFSAATYFIYMAGSVGGFIANAVSGHLSDIVGRRPMILLCLFGAAGSTIARYLARHSFYAFCAFNFVTGLFGAMTALAVIFAFDVFPNKSEADGAVGCILAADLIGRAGGGLMATIFPNDLFVALLPAASLVFVSGLCAVFYLPESSRYHVREKETPKSDDGSIIQNQSERPLDIHKPTLWNILIGNLFDNLGSLGLICKFVSAGGNYRVDVVAPVFLTSFLGIVMCLSPLLFNEFYADAVEEGEEPIMSEQGYKYIFVFMALAIVPGAAASPFLFDTFGHAVSCVCANILTGGTIVALLYVATIEPATEATFGGSIAIFYIGLPLTAISQISTAPMLDR